MQKNSKLFIKLLSLFILTTVALGGCAGPGHNISDSNVSLTETRRSLVKVFGEPRLLSQNGREFTTHFMDKKGRILEGLKKDKVRRFAHITILGERRPYDILVNVIVEAQNESMGYSSIGNDEALAESLAKSVKAELLKSLENRNIIDDFNAF